MKFYISGLIILLLISACNPESIILPRTESTRIKQIIVTDGSLYTYGVYDFYYDSTKNNQLTKIVKDSLYTLTIDEISDSTIRLHDDDLEYVAKVKNNFVVSFGIENDLNQIVLNSQNEIDTIYENVVTIYPYGFFFYTNYNLVWDGNNYTSTKTHEYHLDINFQFSDSTTKQMEYKYTSYLNPGNLPYQLNISNLNYSAFNDKIFDPAYAIQLLGYSFGKTNKNLISEITGGYGPTTINYNYLFNEKNQVIRFSRSEIGQTYNITYIE